MGSERLEDWVIVLEFVPGQAGSAIDYDAVHDVVDELRAWQPMALFAPDRYALQLRVPADRPLAALQRSLALHHRAVGSVGAPAAALARVEILTVAEFDRQWDEFSGRRAAAAPVSAVLSNDVYWATRRLLRATTPSEVTDILVGCVLAVGGEIDGAAPDGRPDKVVVDLTTDECQPLYATADAVSVPGLIVEQSVPALVADSRAVVARVRQGRPCQRPAPTPGLAVGVRSLLLGRLERMFEKPCLDCPSVVAFAEQPGDAVCPGCGLRMYLTDDGQVGRYQAEGWRPGGIQGYR